VTIKEKILSFFMKLYNLKIEPSVVNHDKYLGNNQNSLEIYSEKPDGTIISPFSLSFIHINRLLLINFENDPIFNGIELQVIYVNDIEKPIVILFKHDESQDVYYIDKESMTEHRSATEKLLTNPSFHLIEKIDYRFQRDSKGLDVFLHIFDKDRNKIEFKIREHRENRKLSAMLAPVGASTPKPQYFPYIFLEDFGLVVKKNTEIYIEINKISRIISEFPVRVNGESVYMIRFCFDPILGYLNEEFDGTLEPIKVDKELEVTLKRIRYNIFRNNEYLEIKSMSKKDQLNHKLFFEFSPAIPDITKLKENTYIEGKFSSGTKKRSGLFIGKYELERKESTVEFHIIPTKAWQPFPGVSWVSKYVWKAVLDMQNLHRITMKSEWKNLKRLTSEEFIESTTKKH
jgi:hypothetical protein